MSIGAQNEGCVVHTYISNSGGVAKIFKDHHKKGFTNTYQINYSNKTNYQNIYAKTVTARLSWYSAFTER